MTYYIEHLNPRSSSSANGELFDILSFPPTCPLPQIEATRFQVLLLFLPPRYEGEGNVCFAFFFPVTGLTLPHSDPFVNCFPVWTLFFFFSFCYGAPSLRISNSPPLSLSRARGGFSLSILYTNEKLCMPTDMNTPPLPPMDNNSLLSLNMLVIPVLLDDHKEKPLWGTSDQGECLNHTVMSPPAQRNKFCSDIGGLPPPILGRLLLLSVDKRLVSC